MRRFIMAIIIVVLAAIIFHIYSTHVHKNRPVVSTTTQSNLVVPATSS